MATLSLNRYGRCLIPGRIVDDDWADVLGFELYRLYETRLYETKDGKPNRNDIEELKKTRRFDAGEDAQHEHGADRNEIQLSHLRSALQWSAGEQKKVPTVPFFGAK